VPDARPLFLALALEAAPLGVVRLARPVWRKSAYVATLVVELAGDGVQSAAPAQAEPQNPSVEFIFRRN
jgi:hypothetical protein